MNAEGVINLDTLTSVISELRTYTTTNIRPTNSKGRTEKIYCSSTMSYIKYLKVLILLLDKELLIKLLNEINFLVAMQQVPERFQWLSIFN
jgi:hypothetical protein